MAKLSGEKRRHFRNYLELRLRRAKGSAFQDLAADVLARVHGDNFVPQCPWGAKGDLSCDGYLKDPETVFACYGPENGGDVSRAPDVVAKAKLDFEGAVAKWPSMKAWTFVSNILGVFPAPVTQALQELSLKTGVTVYYFGWQKFEHHLLDMEEEVVQDLVGDIHVPLDFIHLHPEAVKEAISAIATNFSLKYLADVTVPVPADKLALNRIPDCHARHIKNGLLGRDVVASCLQNHPDPSYEGQVSDAFRAKYIELKLQGFEPGDIVDKLYDFALAGHTGATRSTAAWAVIAYLFERCTIFEDKPWEDAA